MRVLPLLLLLAAPSLAQEASERAYAESEFDRFAAPAPDKICLFTPDMLRRGSTFTKAQAAGGEARLKAMFDRIVSANGLALPVCPDGIVIGGTLAGATLDQIGYAVIFAMGARMLGELKGDGELAFVMAHEIAHSVLQHEAAKRAAAAELAAVPDTPMSRLTHGADLRAWRAREFAARRRRMELDADALGQKLAAKAGYFASAGAEYFERDAKTYPRSREPAWDTHPDPALRAARLRSYGPMPAGPPAPGGELAAILVSLGQGRN